MGYEVVDTRGTESEGLEDALLWNLAQELNTLLITTDKGFARYRNENRFGILVVRLRHPNRERIHQRVMQAISQFRPEEWSGLMVVIKDRVQSIWRAKQED